ncbi:MAG: hypothetical protein WC688_00160 [Parachlamydiales bacterium]|jgi:hypothetical protein
MSIIPPGNIPFPDIDKVQLKEEGDSIKNNDLSFRVSAVFDSSREKNMGLKEQFESPVDITNGFLPTYMVDLKPEEQVLKKQESQEDLEFCSKPTKLLFDSPMPPDRPDFSGKISPIEMMPYDEADESMSSKILKKRRGVDHDMSEESSEDSQESMIQGRKTEERKDLGSNQFNFSMQRKEPDTPKDRKYFPISQATPCSKRKRDPIKKLFSHQIARGVASKELTGLLHSYPEIDIYSYEDTSGKKLSIVKQISNKSCGAASALMVMLDLIDEEIKNSPEMPKELPISNNFMNWFYDSSLSDSSDLIRHLKEKFSPVQIAFCADPNTTSLPDSRKNPVGDASQSFVNMEQDEPIEKEIIWVDSGFKTLYKIHEIILETENSFIMSITHPIVQGHWIVIDNMDFVKEQVYLRDPNTGFAYKASFEEIAPQLFGQCLFVYGICLKKKN